MWRSSFFVPSFLPPHTWLPKLPNTTERPTIELTITEVTNTPRWYRTLPGLKNIAAPLSLVLLPTAAASTHSIDSNAIVGSCPGLKNLANQSLAYRNQLGESTASVLLSSATASIR